MAHLEGKVNTSKLSEFSKDQKSKFIASLKDVVANLKDKGYATVGLDEEINLKSLGSRETKELIKY